MSYPLEEKWLQKYKITRSTVGWKSKQWKEMQINVCRMNINQHFLWFQSFPISQCLQRGTVWQSCSWYNYVIVFTYPLLFKQIYHNQIRNLGDLYQLNNSWLTCFKSVYIFLKLLEGSHDLKHKIQFHIHFVYSVINMMDMATSNSFFPCD